MARPPRELAGQQGSEDGAQNRLRIIEQVWFTTSYRFAGCGPKAVRKRSRNALIRQTGAFGLGSRPDCQPHPPIRFSTDGSWAMIEIGTLWLAPCPLTIGNGCSSPTTTSTRFFLP